MKTPQIPPLAGMTPLGLKLQHDNCEECRIEAQKQIQASPELFEAPFNLAGEHLDNSVGAEGQARAQAQAQAEANKSQRYLFPHEVYVDGGESVSFESEPQDEYDEQPRYNARHEGRNDNGDGESYAERNL